MGELEDENKETVDEQLWNGDDEDEEEGEDKDQKLEKDSNVQPNNQETQVQARQGEEKVFVSIFRYFHSHT